MVWWITEAIPIPITALLGVVLCAMLEAAPAPEGDDNYADVVFGFFVDDNIFLFIGSFIIAEAMVVHGLHRRLAYRVLHSKWVGGSTYRIVLAFGLIGALTSPIMSNTAGAAMMLPIALGVMAVVGGMVKEQSETDRPVERLRFGSALMLVITYGITVGGLLLPIGTPPNLIGRELLEQETGEPITFFEWFVIALPIVVVMFVARHRDRPPVQQARGEARRRGGGVRLEERRSSARSSGARRTRCSSSVSRCSSGSCPGSSGCSPATTPTPTRRSSRRRTRALSRSSPHRFSSSCRWTGRSGSFTLTWNEAARIDWGTVILFGSGITFGSLLAETGLAATIGESISDASACPASSASPLVSVDRSDHLGDDFEHGECGDRRADRDLDLGGIERGPDDPGARCDLRRQLRLYAPGLDARRTRSFTRRDICRSRA